MTLPSEDVFDILVGEHADMLLAFIRCYVRDPGTVDDVFQETLLVAWQRLPDFDRQRPFAPWLRGIAFNVIRGQRRRGQREQVAWDEESFLRAVDDRFVQLHEQAGDTFDEKLACLRECLADLPEEFRHPIELHYRESCQLKEVSEKLEISLELAKKRVQRGRKRLLDCILAKLGVAT